MKEEGVQELAEESLKGIDRIIDTLGWVVDNLYARFFFMVASFLFLISESSQQTYPILLAIFFITMWILRQLRRSQRKIKLDVTKEELIKGEIK